MRLSHAANWCSFNMSSTNCGTTFRNLPVSSGTISIILLIISAGSSCPCGVPSRLVENLLHLSPLGEVLRIVEPSERRLGHRFVITRQVHAWIDRLNLDPVRFQLEFEGLSKRLQSVLGRDIYAVSRWREEAAHRRGEDDLCRFLSAIHLRINPWVNTSGAKQFVSKLRRTRSIGISLTGHTRPCPRC